MRTVWKVFHGSKEKGYKVFTVKTTDNGVLFAINEKYIVLSADEVAGLIYKLDRVAYPHAAKIDIKRIEEDEKRYRESRAKQNSENIVAERFDLTE